MTQEEIARASLLEPGVYGFEVIGALDKVSKAGNEMIELKLNVFGNEKEAHVYDYLMEKMAFKLRHFAECTGLLAEYESGTLDAYRCNNKVGYCKLAVDPGNGDFLPKNVVKDYVKPETPLPKLAPQVAPASAAGAPEMPRKLTPEEFNAKHGLDPKAVLDDDLDIPF